MSMKKLLLTCMFLGIFLIIYPSNASAMSPTDQSGSEVGVHILKSDYPPIPPEPNPPSPCVYVEKAIPTRRLPKTGFVDSYWWSIIGSLLFILIVCKKYSLWVRDKKRGVFNEKL